ncbi:hypothetical protein LTR64_001766 [Lithohypha guttulata]|uniref:uncharacterized protein n=1 Tax=Lithohypha guttulata TaxID=1690604 RepID=UPI002DDF7E81|nr:hypothetical protein LTR51_003960 [Lithohypha guttulata]
MDDEFRGFAGEVFTLRVGSDQKDLFVPRDILMAIPYFEHALNRQVSRRISGFMLTSFSGGFIESQTKTFVLPEDNAKTIADVLYYAYTGCVPKLPDVDHSCSREQTARVEAYLLAWVVAIKYKAEQVANSLIDKFVAYAGKRMLHPGVLLVLGEADMRDILLYRLLAPEILWTYKRGVYPNELYARATDEHTDCFENILRRLPHEEVVALVLAAHWANNEWPDYDWSSSFAARDLCKFHVHDLTEPCEKGDDYNDFSHYSDASRSDVKESD